MKMLRKHYSAGTNNPPASFICPLSHEVMDDPVLDKCSHCFEREKIAEWIANGNTCCPISRKDLSLEDLVPNHTLAERIEKWKWQKENEVALSKLAQSSESLSDNTELTSDEVDQEDGIVRASKNSAGIQMSRFPSKKLFRLPQYNQVPNEMMLLPQERQMLDLVRAKNEEKRRELRRRRCRWCCGLILILILVVVVGSFLAMKYLDQTQSGNSEPGNSDSDGN